jgi:hypothetical protein
MKPLDDNPYENYLKNPIDNQSNKFSRIVKEIQFEIIKELKKSQLTQIA